MCLISNVYMVKDEFHFFLVCPALEDFRELYFKPKWKNAITTKQTFYNIMSSNAKSDILSVAKYLLSSFSLRKELLHTAVSIHCVPEMSEIDCIGRIESFWPKFVRGW